jgi:alkylation response protein AidB-like acyl-CoA dehydrogenase
VAEFEANLRDIKFNLFDFLDVKGLTESDAFSDYDEEMFNDILLVSLDQATNLLAPLNASGDEIGLTFENGRVKLPAGWKAAYDTYCASGWNGGTVPIAMGGQGLPRSVYAGSQEMFISANTSFLFMPGLTAAALDILVGFGTSDQKAKYLEKMMTGEWSGTMCLTESNAGTAVPDLRSVATPIADRDGFYHIKGQKIFISAGDHDLTDNIVHMVLARVGDDEGVSLFLVPRMRDDGAGGLTFNDVTTVGIEDKLGIHCSPTCSLSFGDEGDCEGWLIGERAKGLKCMFIMMNEARIAVGVQAVGLASAAYLKAVSYAKERIQGVRIEDIRKRDAPRVAIIEHPDVRRNLMYMKSMAEGARAICIYAAYCDDQRHICADSKDSKRWIHQLEILTPLVKAWCSDEAFKVAEIGIQVFGGYGYIREYGMEQILRDAKIGSIYEGTNGVQALDLLGRKMAKGGGIMLMTMLNEINRYIAGANEDHFFYGEVQALAKARDAVASTAMEFAKRGMKGDIAYSALHATPFLQMFGDLVVGWLLLRHGERARTLYEARLRARDVDDHDEDFGKVLEDDDEARFLHGKIASAHFFIHQILPRVQARKASIQSEDRSALTVVL